MNKKEWREKIYGPYNDAWKIILILKEASDSSPEKFLEYMERLQEFEDIYKGNEFADLLRERLLRTADDVIERMSRRSE